MEENTEIELNGQEHVGESEEKKKKKRKLVRRSLLKNTFNDGNLTKVRRRKKRDPDGDEEEDELDEDAAQLAAFEATKVSFIIFLFESPLKYIKRSKTFENVSFKREIQNVIVIVVLLPT